MAAPCGRDFRAYQRLGWFGRLAIGARVNGEVSSLGGDIHRSNGAQVDRVDDIAAAPAYRDTVRDRAPWRNNGPATYMFRLWDDGSNNIGGVIFITLFAVVVVEFSRPSNPVKAFGTVQQYLAVVRRGFGGLYRSGSGDCYV